MTTTTVVIADCVEHMRSMPEGSIDAVVCDPPYGLEFMGKEWDKLGATVVGDPADVGGFQDGAGGNPYSRSRIRYGATAHQMQAWHEGWAVEALRVLKPGGHLLAFGGPRTYHRLAAGIEDAGFEIRDSILSVSGGGDAAEQSSGLLAWMYGSGRPGFPKSMNLDNLRGEQTCGCDEEPEHDLPQPEQSGAVAGQPDAQAGGAWPVCGGCGRPRLPRGLGTALKPAFEPVVVARKPLSGTVAANVLEHGTGAINVDGCRIGTGGHLQWSSPRGMGYHGGTDSEAVAEVNPSGRWPANVLLDETAAALLDEQTGDLGVSSGGSGGRLGLGDRGGASRFFLTVTPDTLCVLCNLPCAPTAANPSHPDGAASGSAGDPAQGQTPHDAEDRSHPRPASANTAEQASSTTPATAKGATARTDAQAKLAARIVQLARSAESLCDSCATATAQSVAATLHDPTQGSHPGPVSTREHRQRILSRSLALIAAGWESTGITPTTAALSSSFGSALAVTESDTAASTSESDRTRFRYQSKASSAERNAGLDGFHKVETGIFEGNADYRNARKIGARPEVPNRPRANVHATVKPVDVMRWLVRLVTPPGGTVLDPFTGSGTTGVAAHLEGFEFVGIEREPEYAAIAEARIQWWAANADTGAPTDAVLRADRAPDQLGLFGGETAA